MSRLGRRWYLWLVPLLLSLAFLAVDGAVRLRAIHDVTSLTFTDRVPARDAASPTGYEGGRQRLILPALATDGYHWLMQAQQMLAGGGARIREVSYDNAPAGRAVHWSGSVRWWLVAVAAAYGLARPELSLVQAVERVAPVATALLLACMMLVLTPLLAWRLGAVPAGLFALGCVAIHPFYQYSIVGLLDHHNLAAMCCFGAVIFLVAGGGGWVRREVGAPTQHASLQAAAPLPGTAASARRWFIASAIAAGAGLWVSAATIVPVMIGIGIAAIASSVWLSRAARDEDAWRPAPELWRVWGVAGCATSIAFYLLEYFPAHMGWRLEVNHPLYALAWLGAGDLLYRIGSMPGAGAPDGDRASHRWWLAADLVLVAALPITIVSARATFTVIDPFLWALHDDYILEFRTLGSQFSRLSAWHFLQGTTSVLPLLLLPVAALLWRVRLARAWLSSWRLVLAAVAALGVMYFHALVFTSVTAVVRGVGLLPRDAAVATLVVQLVTLLPDAAVVGLLFFHPLRSRAWSLPVPLQAVLALAALPAALVLLLAFSQVRWLGASSGLLLATLVTTAAVVRVVAPQLLTIRGVRVAAAAFLLLLFAPYPAATIAYAWQHGYPTVLEETQVVTRDVAYLLRERLGSRPGVVASGPTTTTWMIYFGGVRGLGTLYWENLEGLKTTATIYGARSADEAKRSIDAHGVTHLVVYSWEPFAREYARLARGARLDRRNPTAAPDAFMVRLLRGDSLPAWLTRIPYTLPERGLLQRAAVWIFEVVPAPSQAE